MALFRRVLFWAHLVCGVAAGVVVLIMCVTGVALTYQRQMQFWADTREYRSTPAPDAIRLPATTLLDAARATDGTVAPTTITFRADPSLPVAVALGQKTIFLNPYTAEVYGEGRGQGMRAFFSTMTAWHRYLGRTGDSRTTGRALTGASNLAFLFIVLSGMYLWWPRSLTWLQVRNLVWFRGGLRAKARDFNWHNAIGFWSALPLAIVVYSGVVISYPWASNMVYRVVGEAPPAPAAGRGVPVPGSGRGESGGRAGGEGRGAGARGGGPGPERAAAVTAQAAPVVVPPAMPAMGVDLDMVINRTMQQAPGWTIITARVPTNKGAPVSFTIDRGDGGQPQARATVAVNAATGAIEQVDDFGSQTPGRRLRSILRFAHTGEVLGLPGQTVAGLVSAGGSVLVYTGLALSARRLAAWWRRRSGRRADRSIAA